MCDRPKRLAVVISHPIQHFAPLFARLGASAEIDLKVFYCCDWGVREYVDPGFGKKIAWDIPLLDGYDSEFLPIKRRPQSMSFFEIDNPQVAKRLADFAPDAVWIHGYGHRTSWRTLRWAHKNSSVLFWGDSQLLTPRGLLKKMAKQIVVRWFFQRCDGFLTIGDNNESYYRNYGVPNRKMYRGSCPIDLDRFRASIGSLSGDDRRRLRAEKGLNPDAVVALFVGQLINIKRPLDFVEAIARARRMHPRLQGLMVGSGPLEDQVRQRIHDLGVEDGVRMPGFVNQSEIPKTLWLGDIVAMCSETDSHPLAVTEAMAVGNAVVASDRVGCVGPTDAARPGSNALVFPCGDVDALASILGTLAEDDEKREAMREASRRVVSTQDVQIAVDAVLKFLRSANCRKGRQTPVVASSLSE
jgi:glycosyltransferase involved in cell wall biosynthesis